LDFSNSKKREKTCGGFISKKNTPILRDVKPGGGRKMACFFCIKGRKGGMPPRKKGKKKAHSIQEKKKQKRGLLIEGGEKKQSVCHRSLSMV